MSSSSSIFSPRLVMILAGIGVITMIGAMLLSSLGNSREEKFTIGPNSFSVSAIGHKALTEAIRNSGLPLMISQYRTGNRLDSQRSVLMLLEPPSVDEDLKALLKHNYTILVLPKRFAMGRDISNIRWLSGVGMTKKDVPEQIIKLVEDKARIVRPSEGQDENSVQLSGPLKWTTNFWGLKPDIDQLQLIKSEKIVPIFATDQGVLIGSLKATNNGTLIIVSDPDLISNFKLNKGDNAKIVFKLLELFLSEDITFFVDETIHGFDRNPNIIRSAFEHPFVYFTMMVILLTVLLLWATVQRFGAAPKLLPQYKTGKAELIENGISLFKYGNHKPEILFKYIELCQNAMARQLRAPRNLDEEKVVEWLDDYGRQHGVGLAFKTIKHRARMSRVSGLQDTNSFMDHVHDKPLLQIARNLEQWKQEMLDGSGSDKINK